MDINKHESVSVKFNGRNHALWEFHFQIFVEGKGLFAILDGSQKETGNDEEKRTWRTKNAQIVTWILNSIKPDIALSLRYFKTAAEIWKHLGGIYSQVNQSRHF